MFAICSMRERDRRPELMDAPDLDADCHERALHGLARINWWSGSACIIWPPILRLARHRAAPLRVLDLATGGGDVPMRLWRKAQQAKVCIEFAGCDVSATAVAHARERAAALQAGVRFFQLDVLHDPIPNDFDVLASSLFLHHLDDEPAQEFLHRAAAATRRLLLINDLRRSFCGYLTAVAATRLLTRSPVVHVDGPLSVRAAFTIPEVQALGKAAGLDGMQISRKWPFRFLLSWTTSRARK